MLSKTSILLIEDDPLDAELFEVNFSELKPGLELNVVSKLNEAITLVNSIEFDVVITDLDLPDSSGIETIREISKNSKGLPIIILSGAYDEFLFAQAADLGVYDYLLKSEISSTTIQRCIRYTLQRHRSDQEKKLLTSQLQHSQKMDAIGQLTGGIAHDFNNKLAIISGHVDLLPLQLKKERPIENSLESIKAAVAQAAQLTKQLLAFSRKQEIQKSVLDLNALTTKSVRLLERLLKKNVHLSFDPGEDLWNVEVDPTQVDQIIMNLVINANDAFEGSGDIHIRTENVRYDGQKMTPAILADSNSPEYVCISVSDNGPGISKEIQKKIFEPFFTTKEIGKGTGLGLSVVHGIVSQHDGITQLNSKVGKGTRFDILFKKSELSAPKFASVNEKKEDFSPSKTILYVEDDSELRSLLASSLEQFGFKVIPAANGHEAQEVFLKKESTIDLILSDVIMPKMSGVELAKFVREKNSIVPFIFLTGYSKQEVSPKGEMPPYTKYLEKPCNYNELFQHINDAIKESKSASPAKIAVAS